MESLHIYFDESIHDRGGFVLGSYVCGRDADLAISDALVRCGLRPGVDEFKSSVRMCRDAGQRRLREYLKEIVRDYSIGVVVASAASRASLASAALDTF